MKHIHFTLSLILFYTGMHAQVGIGTSTPHGALQFSNVLESRKVVLYETHNNDHEYYGFGTNSGQIRYQVGNLGSDHTFYAASSGTTSNELMRIKGNGYVGIGISNPSQKLHVVGNASFNGHLGIGILSANAPLQFSNGLLSRKVVLYESANNDHQYQGFGTNSSMLRYQVENTTSAHVFFAATSGNTSDELMRIKGNGNVGIGITNPVQQLHVDGNTAINGNLSIGTTSTSQKLQVEGNAVINGNMGIGNSSPNAPLQLSNGLGNRKIVLYEGANNSHQFFGFGITPGVLRYQAANYADAHVFYAGTSPSTSNELMRIKGSGDVEIAGKLDIGYHIVEAGPVTVEPQTSETLFCDCPPGEVVVGGGYQNTYSNYCDVGENRPYDYNSWRVSLFNTALATNTELKVYAICLRLIAN